MTIASYAELRDAAGRWMQRSDLADRFPDFLALVEIRLSRDLKLLALEKQQTITTVAAQQAYDLPADILSLVRVFRLESDGRPTELHSFAPEQFNSTTDNDIPRAYYYEAGQVHFPSPAIAGVTVQVIYKSRVPALSDAAPTNAILTLCPDVYLFGVLAEASAYTFDDERAPIWNNRYKSAIVDANKANNFKRQVHLPLESAQLLRRNYDIRYT